MKTTLFLALFVVGCGKLSTSPNLDAPAEIADIAPAPAAEGTHYAVPIDGLPTIGERDALVTIVELTDYECPYCRKAELTMSALKKEYGSDLRIAVAETPLEMHPHARSAALFALAANEHRDFEAKHAGLFYADLGTKALTVDSHDEAAASAALDRAAKLAQSLGVTGTPTFFVNGYKIVGAQPLGTFEAAVNEELASARLSVADGAAKVEVYAQIVVDSRRPPPTAALEGSEEKPFVAATKTMGGAHFLGSPTAPRTFVLFTDFGCPYCAKLDARLRVLVEKHPEVRVVLRHHPLPMHPNARLAAKAAIAAEAQGALAPYVALLFAHPDALDRASLVGYAAAVGIGRARFESDLDSPESERRILEDEAIATEVDVRGVPTTFVDGFRVGGAQSEATFEAALAH
ncbi:hypothetical protein BH09MYX1_BH09MYX1_42480 [soil metagenome]